MLVCDGPGSETKLLCINRCVFCLEVLTVDGDVTDKGLCQTYERPGSSVGFPLTEFNCVWSHLVNDKNYGFPRAPPICVTCGLALERLHGALMEVAETTAIIRTIIAGEVKTESEVGDKYLKLLEELKNARIDNNARKAVINLLEQLGHGGMEEEEYDLWFCESDKDDSVDEKTDVDQFSEIGDEMFQDLEEELIQDSQGHRDVSRSAQDDPLAEELAVTVPLVNHHHVDSSDFPRKGVSCDFCLDSVPSESLLEHVRGHVGDYAISCPNPACDRIFSNISGFRQHFNHKPSCSSFLPENLYKCEVCGHVAINFQGLRGHLMSKHETVFKPFNCPVSSCSEQFSNRQVVFLHIMLRHSANSLKRSSRGHLVLAPPSCQNCPECRIQLNQDQVRNHLVTFHGIHPWAVISCNYCQYLFSSRDQLLEHLSVHILKGSFVSCDICPGDEAFFKMAKLREHYMMEHQIGKKFICELCSNSSYWSRNDLLTHFKRKHPGQKPPENTNEKCGKGGITTMMLVFSEETTSSQGYPSVTNPTEPESIAEPITEKQPKVEAGSSRRKSAHLVREEFRGDESLSPPPAKLPKVVQKTMQKTPGPGESLCDCCLDIVPQESILEHIRGHVGDYVLVCPNPDCTKIFSSISRFRVHTQSKACKKFFKKDLYACEQCDHKATNFQTLRSHLEIHHENDDKPHKCPYPGCSEHFSQRQSVYCHIKFRHTADAVNRHGMPKIAPPTYQNCPECRVTLSQHQVQEHYESCHGTKAEDIISCSYCPYVFQSRIQLVDHLSVHIIQGNTVSCDICHAEGFAKHNLVRQHYWEKHQVGIKFVCEVCNKNYSTNQNLLDHIRKTHGGRKQKRLTNYKCTECDMRYDTERRLHAHNRRFHGAEPLKCQFCSKTFTSQKSLNVHVNDHKGIGKLFVCEVSGCEKSFRSKLSLRCHSTKSHYAKPNADGDCSKESSTDDEGDQTDDSFEGNNDSNEAETQPQSKTNKLAHSANYAQTCDICHVSVMPKKMLEHMQDHIGEYALTCPNPECSRVFSHLRTLSRHLYKSVSCKPFLEKDLYTCDLCDYKVPGIQGFHGHLQRVHETTERSLKCPMTGCTEEFSHRQTVLCHIQRYHFYKPVNRKLIAPSSFQNCPQCFLQLHQDQMRQHIHSVHGTPLEDIISCRYCPDQFPSRDYLVDHFQIHIVKGTPVSCDLCEGSEKYLKMNWVRQHYYEKHQIGKKIPCEDCHRSVWPQQLNNHNCGKQITKTKRFKCTDCTEAFVGEIELMRHKIQLHGAEPYKCQFCDENFADWRKKCRHEKEHKGVITTNTRYICDLDGCGKEFKSPKLLEEHKMSVTHLGKTNAFICAQCGSGFNLDRDLKSHVASVHVTERKFICEECGERFKSGDVLRKHQMIHTGERPFECSVCQQKFRHSEVLKTHLKAHQEKGDTFKPNGPMKNVRKRVNPK